MLLDLAIIILGLSSLYRGRHTGFIRQFAASSFFFGGLFLGAWLQQFTVSLVHSPGGRELVTAVTTLGTAIVGLTIGEFIGIRLKLRVLHRRVNHVDEAFGSAIGLFGMLLSVWLVAALSDSLPSGNLQSQIDRSRIVSSLNQALPDAPQVIARLGRLVDPNGFPDVFAGVEPRPRANLKLPDLGVLQPAVDLDKQSVVKIVGQGCGGIVDGSGFVAKPGFVATNAHVVAGIKSPRVIDAAGVHQAVVVWFDPNLDFAVLRVKGLIGHSLTLTEKPANTGAPAAVLGYPGGGPFMAKPGVIIDRFKASGRNIYGKSIASRNVYEVQADIIPGNSGGPLVAADGTVLGVVFAESTTYQQVGYALTASAVNNSLNQAVQNNRPASTARCAE